MRQNLRLPEGMLGHAWRHASQRAICPPHTHNELEMNLVTRGSATYVVDDRRYDLRAGTMIWLFPAQRHVLIDWSPEFIMWIAVFRPELIADACRSERYQMLRGERPPDRFCKQLLHPGLAELERIYAMAIDAAEDPDRLNAVVRTLLVHGWFLHENAEQITPASDVHPAVERAARLISDGKDPASLRELASHCGLSASRLSRLFHQQTGIRLTRFRQRRRLDRFLTIYGRGQRYTLLEAALRAGFGSYAQFHRVFVEATGQGPAEFRRDRDAAS